MNRSPYASGRFEFTVDGHPGVAYLKSFSGGDVKTAASDAAIGNDNFRIKSSVVNDIEPISIEFGMSHGGAMLKWIQQSWKKNWTTRNGMVVHGDFTSRATLEHHFYDALIQEITFPTLDGKSADAAMMKVKLQPQTIMKKRIPGEGYDLAGGGGAQQKSWAASKFRLTIQGIEGFEYAAKIDSFTIKQEVSKMYTGVDRFPLLVPGAVTFPNITGLVSEARAGAIMDWAERVAMRGMAEEQAQTTGALEYLAPDGRTLLTLKLAEVGIISASTDQSTANSDGVKRVKFEIFVGGMDLDSDGAPGFDRSAAVGANVAVKGSFSAG